MSHFQDCCLCTECIHRVLHPSRRCLGSTTIMSCIDRMHPAYLAYMSTKQRSFAISRPAAWNSLPPALHDKSPSVNTFRQKLKTLIFGQWQTLTEYWFYIPLDTKQVISETFPKPISWLGMEKLNRTQQKHTFTNQKKCTTTQNKHKKTNARFSRLLWHPAWKWRGPIVVLVLHKFVTYLLT